jgi:hypothetical protein
MSKKIVTAIAVFSVTMGCASSSGSADPSGKFVGGWVYQPGSVTTLSCPGQPAMTVDMANTPPSGAAAHFTLSQKSAGIVHELDDLGCEFDWNVEGDALTSHTTNTCSKLPDGRGGMRTFTLVDGSTKSTSDGKTMVIDIKGHADGACDLAVKGTAEKK